MAGKKAEMKMITSGTAKTKVNIRCSPKKMNLICSNMSHAKKEIVNDMGFGSLLHCPKIEYKHELMEGLASRLDTKNFCLRVGVGKIPVTRTEIGSVLGLTTSGERFPELATIAPDVLKQFKGITLKNLEAMIVDQEVVGAQFKRAFIMFALKAFLCPTQNTTATNQCLRAIIDVERPQIYNWGALVHDDILNGVNDFRDKGVKSINGCVHVLLVLYFHRDRYGKFEDHNYNGPRAPWIQHWTHSAISEWTRKETTQESGLLKRRKRNPGLKCQRASTKNKDDHADSEDELLVNALARINKKKRDNIRQDKPSKLRKLAEFAAFAAQHEGTDSESTKSDRDGERSNCHGKDKAFSTVEVIDADLVIEDTFNDITSTLLVNVIPDKDEAVQPNNDLAILTDGTPTANSMELRNDDVLGELSSRGVSTERDIPTFVLDLSLSPQKRLVPSPLLSPLRVVPISMELPTNDDADAVDRVSSTHELDTYLRDNKDDMEKLYMYVTDRYSGQNIYRTEKGGDEDDVAKGIYRKQGNS